MTSFLRRFLYISCGDYYDDVVTVAPSFCAVRYQVSVVKVHDLFRLMLDAEKHHRVADANPFLGVVTDFSTNIKGYFAQRILKRRITQIRAAIAKHRADNELSPGDASTLRAKMYFSMTSGFGKVGRAGLQALVERQYTDSKEFALTTDIMRCFDFCEALLLCMPERRFVLSIGQRKPLLIWSDAAYEDGVGSLGFVIYNPESRTWYESSATVPNEYYSLLVHKKQHIHEFEVLAAILAYFTLHRDTDIKIKDREIIHFIDNYGAMASLLKGRSKSTNANVFIAPFHFFNARMRSFVWWQWIATKENVADFPSRFDFKELYKIIPSSATKLDMVLPNAQEWNAGLHFWMNYAYVPEGRVRSKSSFTTAQKAARKRVRQRNI